MLASVGMPAGVVCSSPGPTRVCRIGFLRCVIAVIFSSGSAGCAGPT